MSVVGLRPITLNAATLYVAEDDYTASVTQVLFVPQVRWSWVDQLGAETPSPAYDGVAWTCTIGHVQDLSTPGALSTYLIEHAAQTRTITFIPTSDDPEALAVRADVMVIPGPIGGVPNQHLTATVTLPCFEEPALGRWEVTG